MARTPLYLRAEAEMRRRISDGDWPVGQRLGNEFELAEEFNVSQGTMRRALITLESEGFLSRKPGRGTMVASRSARPAGKGQSASALVDAAGGAVVFEVHRSKQSLRLPQGSEVALFGSTELLDIERLLKRDGQRAALERLVVCTHRVPDFDEAASPDLAEALAAHGATPATLDTEVTAQMTSMGDSVALSCDRNTALLCLTRTARDADGQALARQVLRVCDPAVRYR